MTYKLKLNKSIAPTKSKLQEWAVSAVVGLFFIKGTLSTKKTEKLPDGTIDWSKIPEAYTIAIVAPWITWLIYWVIKAIFI